MGEIISIINQKGGCGKTTTTVNLSTALALLDKKVLVIDMDPQGNATTGFGIQKADLEKTIYTVLSRKDATSEAIIPTMVEGLYILPSNIALSGAEVELSREIGYHSILEETLKEIKELFDYILIDVPPSLGILTLNALVASDSVIIPIQAEYYALEGMADLIKTMNLIEERLQSPSPIKGILMTLYDSRTRLGRDVHQEVKNFFGEREYIFKTTIPRNVRLAEAPSYGKPCILYDSESSGTISYMKLAQELLKLEEE
ncbi:ParA family protein [Methanobacterium alkalithermotolerans]|uniref:ParA family protein n=1 Tax=Methanobacterium alkalithermotolerans TaxID=2731220 RepID=A0A8T8K677_9EURY|nr:ParA family protein [Methanobacterium alkalithermotolerans]QUH23429.1 ParA family protein [Methanobacterium alkalithermotolerans]